MKIAIVYGSSMGKTTSAANMIAQKLALPVKVLNVADIEAKELNEYDGLICGTSTWGTGDMQDDWEAFDFSALNLDGKKMAVFGVGDSSSYSDDFCSGMAKLYSNLKERGGVFFGDTETAGYNFDSSEAVNDAGNFVGLALDYDNEEDMSEDRITNWVNKIKHNFV